MYLSLRFGMRVCFGGKGEKIKGELSPNDLPTNMINAHLHARETRTELEVRDVQRYDARTSVMTDSMVSKRRRRQRRRALSPTSFACLPPVYEHRTGASTLPHE